MSRSAATGGASRFREPATGEPVAPAPARDDLLTAELRSSDENVRYRAAARAFQELEASEVSLDARNALLDIVSNGNEREGVRLWAARAVAKHDPKRALRRFVELNSSNLHVDGDAWLVLGPLGLPALTSRCTPADCPDTVFTTLALIVGDSPSHRDSRNAIPLLVRESTHSEQRKALVYRTLGAFGSSLVPELEALRNHDDPTLRKAASEALAAVRHAR